MHARAFDRKIKESKEESYKSAMQSNAVNQVPFQTTEIVERQKKII